LWWGIAAGIITFQGPFTDTGNGYFAAWAGFLFSIVGIGASVTKAWSVAANSGPTIGLFIASVVVFCALLGDEAIGGGKAYQGEAIYALIISILTTLVVAIMLILESNGQEETVVKVKMPMYLFFGVLWIVLACLVTFSGPFTGGVMDARILPTATFPVSHCFTNRLPVDSHLDAHRDGKWLLWKLGRRYAVFVCIVSNDDTSSCHGAMLRGTPLVGSQAHATAGSGCCVR